MGHLRVSKGKGGGGVKMFMLPMVGYGYFLESPNPKCLVISVPCFIVIFPYIEYFTFLLSFKHQGRVVQSLIKLTQG